MLDGGFVALASPARGLLPAPAEAVQQATNMIAIVTDSEATPNQIGHSLRGPDGRGEPKGSGSSRQQTRQQDQVSVGQFGRSSGARAAMQGLLPSPSEALRPHKHGLTAHAELSGNRRERLPTLQLGKGGQTPLFHRSGITSGTFGAVGHRPTVAQIKALSIYLCRDL